MNKVMAREALRLLAPVMRQAGKLALEIRAEGRMSVGRKLSHQDIVTRADREVEALLTDLVRASFPEHGIEGEEGAYRRSADDNFWFFDPIDGTTNYAAGNPMWGISGGLHYHGKPLAGAIYFPTSGELVTAVRGEGAKIDTDALRADPFEGTLKDALVGVGLQSEYNDFFGVLRPHCRNVLAQGSCVAEIVQVAKGQTSAFLHTGATQFDVAAAALIAEEAGCTVANLDGKRLDFRAEKIPIVVGRSQELVLEIQDVWLDWKETKT